MALAALVYFFIQVAKASIKNIVKLTVLVTNGASDKMTWNLNDPSSPYQSPQFGNAPDPYQQYAPRKHSVLGIISFVAGVVSGLLALGVMVFAVLMAVEAQGRPPQQTPAVALLGLAAIAALGISPVGLGLGIASIFQSNVNKLFGILGLIANAIVFFGLCGIMALGLAIQA